MREELGKRIAFLFSKFNTTPNMVFYKLIILVASALSGAFGGLLAWAILYMDGVAGLHGWRW
jgi:hypothetical protein